MSAPCMNAFGPQTLLVVYEYVLGDHGQIGVDAEMKKLSQNITMRDREMTDALTELVSPPGADEPKSRKKRSDSRTFEAFEESEAARGRG